MELYAGGSRVAEFQGAPKPAMPVLSGYAKYVSPLISNRIGTDSSSQAPADRFRHAPPDKIEVLEWIPPGWALLPTYSPDGMALGLDGSTHVTLAGKPGYGFGQTDPFSVAFWIKRPDTGNSASLIMSKSGVMLPQGIRIWGDANGMISLRMTDDASGQITVSSFHDIADGYWHWVVLTYDGSGSGGGLNAYVDGRNDSLRWDDASLAGSIANGSPIAIGAGNTDTRLTPDALLDDVMIYSEELSAEYVSGVHECHRERAAALAAAEGALSGSSHAGGHACAGGEYGDALLAHLGFEGDLSDSSGNGNDGTARGGVRYA